MPFLQSAVFAIRTPRTPPNTPTMQPLALPASNSQVPGFAIGKPSTIVLDGKIIKITCLDKFGKHHVDKFDPAVKFGFFKYLPKEIRCVIWVMAAEDEARLLVFTEQPRFLGTVQVLNSNAQITQQNIFGAIFRARIDRRPQVASASKEALKVLLDTGVYKPAFALHGASRRAFFNPSVDTIRLCTDSMGLQGRLPLLTLGLALENPMELAALTRLEFPYATFVKHHGWAGANIKQLVNLRTLVLSDTDYDWKRDAVHPYVMEMKFFPDWDPSTDENFENFDVEFEMTPWCEDEDGVILYGRDAMDTVLPNIRHEGCRRELMDKWSVLSRITNTSFLLPDTLLKVTYIPNNLS